MGKNERVNAARLERLEKGLKDALATIAEMRKEDVSNEAATSPNGQQWLRAMEFRLMMGRMKPDGTRIPITRKTFAKLVKENPDTIQVKKVGNLVYVTKYPGNLTSYRPA